MLPAQKFWGETVSLLNVMWPRSNQWDRALLRRNFQLYNNPAYNQSLKLGNLLVHLIYIRLTCDQRFCFVFCPHIGLFARPTTTAMLRRLAFFFLLPFFFFFSFLLCFVLFAYLFCRCCFINIYLNDCYLRKCNKQQEMYVQSNSDEIVK